MITVVIPYFQRESGILSRALVSIAAQQACPLPVHVIVVDDASPIPATQELAGIGKTPYTVQVVQQPNGGPGAARNTGLDHAPQGTRYIAFLDSDDEWTPDHLSRAVAALEAGFDFYFADLYQLGQTTAAFARAGRIRVTEHPVLPSLFSDLHAYQGDMFDQIIRGNLIGTPTVVYDFERFGAQRFRTEFANAGEDYLFWMALVRSGAKIVFSSRAEVRCGKGVNVYAGSGWGSDQHLLRLHNELKYRITTTKLFALTTTQRAHIQTCVRDLRRSFARDLLRRLAHRIPLPWNVLRWHVRLDPWGLLRLPIDLIAVAVLRLRGS